MSAQIALETSLNEIDRLRGSLKRASSNQVYSPEERAFVKATAFSWFKKHRAFIVAPLGSNKLADVDNSYNLLLTYGDKQTTRVKYDKLLKGLHQLLLDLRTQNIIFLADADASIASEEPPDFSTLIGDVEMQAILTRRWQECSTCVSSNAPLAATVMMGGLLEALLLSRINQLSDKSKVFTAAAAPKDKAGKALPLNEWTLKNYIEVANELKWISQTVKDVGTVLRDYRNYVHPYKERSHGIRLLQDDAKMLWDVSKSIAKRLLSLPKP